MPAAVGARLPSLDDGPPYEQLAPAAEKRPHQATAAKRRRKRARVTDDDHQVPVQQV
jgi:hypothetical protein